MVTASNPANAAASTNCRNGVAGRHPAYRTISAATPPGGPARTSDGVTSAALEVSGSFLFECRHGFRVISGLEQLGQAGGTNGGDVVEIADGPTDGPPHDLLGGRNGQRRHR